MLFPQSVHQSSSTLHAQERTQLQRVRAILVMPLVTEQIMMSRSVGRSNAGRTLLTQRCDKED